MSKAERSLANNSPQVLQVDDFIIDYSILVPIAEQVPYFSRGSIVSGAISGEIGYDTVATMTDLDATADPLDPVEYDPRFDCRVDKFDAVEMGTASEEVNNTPTSGQANTTTSSKEKE